MENPLGEELAQAEQIYNTLVDFFVNYSMQVIGAIIILLVGFVVARVISRWLIRFLTQKSVDVTLTELLGSIVYFSVLFCFILISLGKFGISITPFVAAMGAFALGAGLAVQGVIGNYGAGLSIIFARPFVVGNTLSVQGVSGVVEKITLPYTILATEDGEKITIPNKEIIGQILENSFENKLVETVVTIQVTADVDTATAALIAGLGKLDCVSEDPSAQVGIDSFNEHAIAIGIRVWVPTATYYQGKYAVNSAIYHSLKAAGIPLFVPRQEVQIVS